MPSSSPAAAGSWRGDAWAPSVDDTPFDQEHDDTVLIDPGGSADPDEAPDDWGRAEDPSYWQPVHDNDREHPLARSGDPGVSARVLVLSAAVGAGGCAALNLALTGGRLTFFFDCCFVVLCLVGTMAVNRRDLFTAGVLPPLAYGVVIAVLALAAPRAFGSVSGVGAGFLTGLAAHVVGLVGGYAAALLVVAARMSADDVG